MPPKRDRTTIADTLQGLDTKAVSNPSNATATAGLKPGQEQLVICRVKRAGVGHYDHVVTTPADTERVCTALAGVLRGMRSGANESKLYPEGASVLAWIPTNKDDYGIILGAVPNVLQGSDNFLTIPALTYEGAARTDTESAFSAQYDGEDPHIIRSNDSRPSDVFPGDMDYRNELDVGLSVRKLLTSLQAGEGAKVQAFLIDNLVRIVCSNFQQFTAAGTNQVWATDGRCTSMHETSMHRCEAVGAYGFGAPVFDLSESSTRGHSQSETTSKSPQSMPVPRFTMYEGALSNGLQYFISSPEQVGTVRSSESEPKDKGLLHVHAGSNGSFALKAAGDIVLERTSRIPVPVRRYEVWDPEGNGFIEHAPLVPYTYTGTTPESRLLELRNALKMQSRDAYINYALNAAEGSFTLPAESETPILVDKYDEVDESEAAFEKHKDEGCQVVLSRDGSVALRNHTGAEIALVGGKVVISAPDGIDFRTGGDVLTMANGNVVTKARESVDISATLGDVRAKAERNMHVYGGASTLLECGAEGVAEPEDEDENAEIPAGGEEFTGKGMVISAPESRIVLRGATVHLSAVRSLVLEALDTAGEVIIASRNLIMTALATCRMSVKNISELALDGAGAILFGRSVSVAADTSAAIYQGNRIVNFETDQVDENVYTILSESQETLIEYTQDTQWLEPFDKEALEKWKFKFRSSDSHGIPEAKGGAGTGTGFELVQSWWSYLQSLDGIASAPEKWEEHPVHDTYPWPGARIYHGDVPCYLQLDKETNVVDSATGAAVAWESIKESGAKFKDFAPMHDYIG